MADAIKKGVDAAKDKVSGKANEAYTHYDDKSVSVQK